MHIHEIYINPSREEYPENYLHYFVNVSHQETLSTGLTMKVSTGDSMIHIGIFDKDAIVSYVGLHQAGIYNQVDMQCTINKYRGQGYIRKCIEYAITHFSPVISDVGQTTEAKETWMALIQRPHLHGYYWLNLETQKKEPIKWGHDGPTPNPWDDTDSVVILALPQQTSSAILEMRAQRAAFDSARGRRDPWLGREFTEFNP